MPRHDTVSLTGKITDVFAHRFVLEAGGRRVLADIGPGAGLDLTPGEEVEIQGDQHPSEIKVARLTRGRQTIEIARKPKPGPGKPHPAADRDPQGAIDALAATGVEPIGTPRRRPHHYEITARDDGELVEFHVHDDGRIHRAPHPAP